MLGQMYGYTLAGSGFMDDIDIIVPVPLSSGRQRERGYNQSALIAEGLSASTRVPFRNDILIRTGRSESQTRRGRYERWENVEGLFAVRDPSAIRGKHILIADDVITTGSTMEACVDAVSQTGDIKVSVVALATAQKLTL